MLKFYTLFSGSTGNCSFLTNGETRILIDAGVSCKRVTDALLSCSEDVTKTDALLITHEHSDHVAGVDVLCRRKKVPLYANREALDRMILSDEVYDSAVRIAENEPFSVGDIKITPFLTPHDTPRPLGFVFEDLKTGNKLGYASDLGHISPDVERAMTACDAIYIESNHDIDMLFSGSYPYSLKQRVANKRGHLSNAACGEFLRKTCSVGTKYVMLGHLSRENNSPRLAYETSKDALLLDDIRAGSDMLLYVAKEAMRSEVITL